MHLDALPHELGHHRDLVITRTRRVGRGERLANAYAREVRERCGPIYGRRFEI